MRDRYSTFFAFSFSFMASKRVIFSWTGQMRLEIEHVVFLSLSSFGDFFFFFLFFIWMVVIHTMFVVRETKSHSDTALNDIEKNKKKLRCEKKVRWNSNNSSMFFSCCALLFAERKIYILSSIDGLNLIETYVHYYIYILLKAHYTVTCIVYTLWSMNYH